MGAVERGRYTVSVDASFHEDRLCYDFCLESGMKIYAITYSRKGKTEVKNISAVLFIAVLEKLGFVPNFVQRKRLSTEEKRRIRKVFPYISQYKGLTQFNEQFSNAHLKYPYDEYDEAERLAQAVIQAKAYDHCWHIMWGDRGTLYLTALWVDETGTECVAVFNDRVIYSNISYADLLSKELTKEISIGSLEKTKEIGVLFDNFYPNLHMGNYLLSGGVNVFRLCHGTRNGDFVFELLAKSRLGILADEYIFGGFEDLNIHASTPSSVMGLPMKLLRYANDHYYSIALSTLRERKALLYAWNKYPELFDRELEAVDVMWLNFLQASKEDSWFRAELLDKLPLKRTIKYLHGIITDGKMNDYVAFVSYENYVMYSQRLGEFSFGKYPSDLIGALEKTIDLLNEIRQKDKERKFREKTKKDDYQLYMEDLPTENFCIIAPESRKDLVQAGKDLHNCLAGYASKILHNTSVVGLVYQKNEVGKVIIGAIEIRNNKIYQAKTFCNRKFEGSAKAYISGYAVRKRVNTSLCYDLRENEI
ncbi:PcfJ domain-containing protein [Eubacterium ramulus]